MSALTLMNGTAAWDVTGTHDVTKCIDVAPFVLCDAPVISDTLEEFTQKAQD